MEEQRLTPMNDDQTPINARPKRQPPEAFEDLSLALRDRLIWPLGDWFLSLGDRGRIAVAGGAAVLALGIGIGGYSLVSSDTTEPTSAQPVAAAVEPAPKPAPQPKPEPEATLQGATPVLKAPDSEDASQVAGSKALESSAPAATASNTGNAATDTISSNPAAQPAGASASASTAAVDGPPAGPAGIAVARKFADAFVVYETGGEKSEVRKAFAATATPELTKALMQRPPRQPEGVEVPKAKVLNVVAAPSHDRIYPVSVSLLRVGSTSELRLELEQLKDKRWRVVNVLG
ncbi:MAG TPA: hypothetical protein VFT79_01905 [Solirubrobacterales bacterium]|nr:hypothetical protein [Solirubrobacterales bacterium]